MDYTLAKELKDAGFPLELNSGGPLGNLDISLAKMPTLEELIEACFEFQRVEFVPSKDVWQAVSSHPDKGDVLTANAVGHGNSPTTAVARLWLALKREGLVEL